MQERGVESSSDTSERNAYRPTGKFAARTETLHWPTTVDMTQSVLEYLSRNVSGELHCGELLTELRSGSESSSICPSPNVDLPDKLLAKLPSASQSNAHLTTPMHNTHHTTMSALKPSQ